MFNDEEQQIERFVNSREFKEKVKSILGQAKDCGLSGDELHLSLLTSGAVLGLETTQRHFEESNNAVVSLLRNCIKEMDVLILSTTDAENIEQINKMRASFSKFLSLRTKALYAAYVRYVEDTLKIDKVHISDKIDLDSYSQVELQKIGFSIYQNLPIYFCSWNHFTADGRIDKFKCHCPNCMLQHLKMEAISEWDSMDAAIDSAGGIDKLFREFGAFALNAIKTTLQSISYGDEGSHGADIQDSVKQTETVLRAMKIAKGREQF